MRLLSLDPSSTCTGWACFDDGELIDYGSFRPPQKADVSYRIDWTGGQVSDLIRRRGDIDRVVIEDAAPPYGNKRRGHDVYVRAVSFIRWECEGILGKDAVEMVMPVTWKSSAKKIDTIRVVNAEHDLELVKKDNDIADAIALGDWYLRKLNYDRIMAEHNAGICREKNLYRPRKHLDRCPSAYDDNLSKDKERRDE